MLKNLRRRLAEAEQRTANIVRQRKVANCICDHTVFIFRAEQFEAEMNRPCPAHGFRRLDHIVTFLDGTSDSAELDELIAVYEARLAKSEQELANAS